MKFKIGDRVKFLDEHGGGIITKIVSHNLVHVAIEDGFEIPTLTSNLLKAEAIERVSVFAPPAKPVEQPIAEEEDGREQPLLHLQGRKAMPRGLYLIFLPQDQKWLTTGKFDILLINDTPWDVLFNLWLEQAEGGYRGKDFDGIAAGHSYHLATVKPERLENWGRGTLQFLFRQDQAEYMLLPASIDFNIKAYRFLKEGAYEEYRFVEGRAVLVNLSSLEALQKAGQKKDKGLPEAEQRKARVQDNELIHSFRKGEGLAEVDLHIEVLMKEVRGLSNHEILNIQLGHFLACLESGIRSGYRELIFIHGTGSGKLKAEILERLREYKGVEAEDAPMKDYGVGALRLRLSQKASL
jgi:hypothetical protein